MSELCAARWLFVLMLGLYLLGARGHFLSTDEVILYQVTQSLWEKGDLAVSIADQEEAPLGRDGRHYAQYGPGQSVAALPLYGLGRAVETLLRPGSAPYRAFQQGRVSRPGVLWSGEVELFFVSLLNSLLTAAAVAVFFLVLRQDGIEPPWALAWSLVLGAAAYLGSLSSSFFQHPSEALFALAAFYLFRADEVRPSWRRRAAAGLSVALMLQFRPPAIFALPGLVLLHGTIVLRRDSPRLSRVLGELAPVIVALFASFALLYLGHHAKFGDRPVGYAAVAFSTPILLAVKGYLVSPGLSLFFSRPCYCLPSRACPPSFEPALRSRRSSPSTARATSSATAPSTSGTEWSASVPAISRRSFLSCSCPRPTGSRPWRARVALARAARRARRLGAQPAQRRRELLGRRPARGLPRREAVRRVPLLLDQPTSALAHARALLAPDDRVDFWLANLARVWGPATALVVALAPAALMALAIAKLAATRHRARAPGAVGGSQRAWLWSRFSSPGARSTSAQPTVAPPNDSPEAIDAGLMRRGMDALSEGRPQAAETLVSARAAPHRRPLRRSAFSSRAPSTHSAAAPKRSSCGATWR